VRILYLAPDAVPFPKGASRRIERSVATLRALGHEVALFTSESDAPALPDHTRVGLTEENYLGRMLHFRCAAAEWLAARQADVVHFRSIWEGVAALEWARQRGARALFELHGLPSVELPYHFPALARRPRVVEKIIAEERRVLAGVSGVIVPSRTSAQFLLRLGVPGERLAVVPNAVDTDLFVPPVAPPPHQPPFRLVYEGTLSPWQGLEVLLEALALLRGRGGLELHVVGPAKSAWRASIRRRAHRLRVHHVVHLSGSMEMADLVPVLQSAHVCVAPLPSDARNVLQGCCPIKLLDYMAAGRPIVSTAIAPVEEILEHGVTAHLVRPSSAMALADGLVWMLDHPVEREALGRAAREAALARWCGAEFEAQLRAALDRLA
jgi:glycosyltransferase involved in cell wall biosynthesis